MLINKTLFSGKTTYTLCDEHEFNDFVLFIFLFFYPVWNFPFCSQVCTPLGNW